MEYVFYSKSGNPLTVWAEILQTVLAKNAPDNFYM
jgi:hypothetical protein